MKEIIVSLVRLPLGFSLMTNVLLVAVLLLHVVPCLIRMPEIAPAPIGSGNYYPGTVYSDMKIFLTLFLSLYLFQEVKRNSVLQKIPSNLSAGLVYGVYLSFLYIGIAFLRTAIYLFGFSYGLHGWGFIYYITAIVLLFRYLKKRYTPWKALMGAFFTVFMSGMFWEFPYYVWRPHFAWRHTWDTNNISRLIGRLGTLSLIPIAYKTFDSKKSYKYFVLLFAILMLLDVIAGHPIAGISGPALGTTWDPKFTYFDSVKFVAFTMFSRIAAYLGLSYIFWAKKEDHTGSVFIKELLQ